ncbi:hypothetical protein SDC9_200202 [bioreactor metagenome]|uniref:Uncharacterized protein n=1 Tax=bioreactor metagenome TaxID=1076179 RepID=A0A645IN61_9ZZZZ
MKKDIIKQTIKLPHFPLNHIMRFQHPEKFIDLSFDGFFIECILVFLQFVDIG